MLELVLNVASFMPFCFDFTQCLMAWVKATGQEGCYCEMSHMHCILWLFLPPVTCLCTSLWGYIHWWMCLCDRDAREWPSYFHHFYRARYWCSILFHHFFDRRFEILNQNPGLQIWDIKGNAKVLISHPFLPSYSLRLFSNCPNQRENGNS